MATKLSGKIAIITGAAGDIGRASAMRLARDGCNLVLVDLAGTDLESVKQEVESNGATCLAIRADVTKSDDVQDFVSRAVRRFGKIDLLFNNAGVQGCFTPTNDYPEEDFSKVIKVNVEGVFLCLKYTSQAMVKSGQGVIVNTASLAGMIGPQNMLAYSASKHAVVGMTKTAAKDLAPYNIRVCAISPGLVEGKMWKTQVAGQAQCKQGDDAGTINLEQMKDRMLSGIPMKRLGRLDEIASVVAFLFSDDASYLTGTVIPIDGGRLQ
ncbi:levodione reductase-like [Corticium candelabrum]|uniref:levodione reductase-like n=1 Tax=Corticium candelabrum TaxID=121492 RepID=UPI002E2756EA|nr:levodione reductase-like [Corticium candelabrum]